MKWSRTSLVLPTGGAAGISSFSDIGRDPRRRPSRPDLERRLDRLNGSDVCDMIGPSRAHRTTRAQAPQYKANRGDVIISATTWRRGARTRASCWNRAEFRETLATAPDRESTRPARRDLPLQHANAPRARAPPGYLTRRRIADAKRRASVQPRASARHRAARTARGLRHPGIWVPDIDRPSFLPSRAGNRSLSRRACARRMTWPSPRH